jgi:hypothetical protein
MVQWPWQKGKLDCKYLIKHYGRSGKVSGIEVPNVKVGEISIEPKLLQAASQALELIDASQYYLCQSVNNAPDDETKRKYYELMMQDTLRAKDFIMGLAAFSINPQSKNVEDGIMKMLLQNHSRALQIEEEKIEVNPEPLEDNSDKIEIANTSFKDKINELEKSEPSYTNDFQQVKSQPSSSKIEPVGILHLLTENFSTAELRTLCFEFKLDYDDIAGETKQDKARELILYLKRRDKLIKFYDFLTDYIARRG